MLWFLVTAAAADSFSTGTLSQDTVVHALVLEGELFRYYVTSTIDCRDQDGNEFGQPIFYKNAVTASQDTLVTCILSGDEQAPDGDGPWYFEVVDLDERGFPPIPGRVFSYEWIVTSEDADFSHTFYVPAPVNSDAADALDDSQSSRLMKVQVAGLRGSDLRISANTTGLTDLHVQSGAPSDDPPGRLPLFLSEPGVPRVPVMPADVSDWSLSYSLSTPGCEGIIPGVASATMSFGTSLTGLSGIGCDINGDGTLDPSSLDGDVLGGFSADNTGSTWEWYGEDASGSGHIEPGEYTCTGGVFVGGLHALVENADVADPGVRLFAYDSSTVAGVPLYWNDQPLRDEVPLASGETAPLQSGAEVSSDSIDTAQEAPTNSHGWGNLTESLSRGSIGWIDTWTDGDFYVHGYGTVIVLDKDSDEDSDGVPLSIECGMGTGPGTPDSDGDGVDDGQELKDGTDPTDSSDYKTDDIDTGTPPDTGEAPDTAPPTDTVPSRGFGNLSGGAYACAAAPRRTPPLLLLMLPLLVFASRRR